MSDDIKKRQELIARGLAIESEMTEMLNMILSLSEVDKGIMSLKLTPHNLETIERVLGVEYIRDAINPNIANGIIKIVPGGDGNE